MELVNPSPEGQGFMDELYRLLGVVWKRKWIVVLFLAATLAGTLFHTMKQPRIYRATATLVIDRSSPNVLSGIKEVVELGSTGYWGLRRYFKTQYEIITSRALAQAVVDRLGLDNDLHFLGIDPADMPPEEIEAKIAASDPAGMLATRVRAEPLEDSFMVYVHVEDQNPEFAARLATAVAQTYRDENLAFKRRAINRAQNDLEKLVDRLRTEKENSAESLLSYERDNQVGTLANRRNAIDVRMKLLNQRTAEFGADLAAAKAAYAQVKKYRRRRDVSKVSYGAILKSRIVQSLKTEAIEVRAELAKAKVTYLSQHPKVIQLKARLKDVESMLRREVRNEIDSIRLQIREKSATLKNLTKELNRLRGNELDLAAQELEYGWLKQRAEESKTVYDQVSRRLLETRISEQVETNNVWLLDEAIMPGAPVSPRVRMNIIMGIFFGLIGGMAFAFLFELADNSVKTDHDLEQLVQAPVLGLMPIIYEQPELGTGVNADVGESEDKPPDPALIVFQNPKSLSAEYCRSIRTNLMFMSPDEPIQSLLITSANPREGKTTVSASVAITMAMSGSKVVLVDTDMRRPRLHKVFTVDESTGMSSALISGNSVAEFCQPTIVPNLSVIPCGPIPPNPAELFHTRRFTEVVEQLKGLFDYVIFDSPPVLAVTDSLIIGKHVDGVMMVVRAGNTSKGAVVQSRRRMDAIGVRLYGCVMNQVDAQAKNYRYHYHYYGGKYYTADTEPSSKG